MVQEQLVTHAKKYRLHVKFLTHTPRYKQGKGKNFMFNFFFLTGREGDKGLIKGYLDELGGGGGLLSFH